MREERLKPRVIVYEIRNKSKYDYLKANYRLYFSNPEMFSIPELKYEYFVSPQERIKKAYRDYGVPDLLAELAKKEPVKEPVKVEVEPTPLPEEDNAVQDVLEGDIEPSDVDVESLSWHELRAAAKEAGLEGTFNKQDAIEFLKAQQE
jgi:hypothetical protein